MSRSYRGLAVRAALTVAAAVWGLPATRVEAHSIYIFAFAQGAQICASSYFGGQGQVRGGQVAMATEAGETLATARTDERGQVCFERPEPARDLVFTVEASGGHRAEFRLPAAEQAVSEPAGPAADPERAAVPAAEAPTAANAGQTSTGALTERDLQKALSPIMMKLAEMESLQNSRVELKDVVGGLGWLIGLAGAALWASGRKNAARGKENG